jgi:hypothetical protein
VKSRQFVCNDSRIIELLDRFVPVVDSPSNYTGWDVKVDRSRLQYRLVDQILGQTTYRQITGAQGLYVVTPSGKLIAGTTEHSNPSRVLAEMRKGLDEYSRIPKSERLLPRAPDPRTDKIETLTDDPKPPRDGLVLRMVSRGLATPGVSEQDTRHPSYYKLDRLWFTREQARSFLPTDLKAGAKTQVRGSALNLLVRLNLGTFIQPNPAWNAEDVRSAALNSEVTAVRGNVVEVRFSGDAELRSDNRYSRRSYTPKLLGSASYNTQTQSFTKFELLSVGTHTVGDVGEDSRTYANGPKAMPLGVLFTINGTNSNDRVVPHFYRAYNSIARER